MKPPTPGELLERLRDMEDAADAIAPGLGAAWRLARITHQQAVNRERAAQAFAARWRDPRRTPGEWVRFLRVLRDCKARSLRSIRNEIRPYGYGVRLTTIADGLRDLGIGVSRKDRGDKRPT